MKPVTPAERLQSLAEGVRGSEGNVSLLAADFAALRGIAPASCAERLNACPAGRGSFSVPAPLLCECVDGEPAEDDSEGEPAKPAEPKKSKPAR